jgi:hypothetical protein
MKDLEIMKQYSNKKIYLVNKARHCTNFSDSRIVHKILVTIHEKFKATISSF